MYTLKINNRFTYINKNNSILEACTYLGIKIPRFCYHEKLSIAGNCRMCLVETDKSPKPIASCATPIINDLEIVTHSPLILKARENILELLLINHPLDCPICDQGGECDLQDQYHLFGNAKSRFKKFKRSVTDKNFNIVIKTIMTRCIHCTRCIRFGLEICGSQYLGTTNRGTNMEIGNYINKLFFSEISGNLIDLCPVGALTTGISSFKARPWELHAIENIDLTDSSGSSIYICLNEFGPVRILPKKNKNINENWISDKARFCFDKIKNNIYKKNNFNIQSFISKENIILINSEMDLEALCLLKHLNYISKNQIKCLYFSTQKLYTNIYFWDNNIKLKNINNSNSFCLLISSYLKIENILLNIKLQTKFLYNNIKVYGLGIFYKSMFNISFLKLNINQIFNILKLKHFLISKALLIKNKPIIIFGNSIKNRINDIFFIFYLLKNKIPTLLIYFINIFSNSESLKYLSFNRINNHILKKKLPIIGLQIDDSILSRKLFLKNNYKFILGNNNNINENFWLTYTFPIIFNYEQDKIYINLEKRPQLTNKIFTDKNFSINNYINSFISLFNSKLEKNFNTIEIFIENTKKIEIFDKKNNMFNNIYIKYTIPYFNYYYMFLSYPIKTITEDFYTTSTLTKTSKTLIECSRHLRKQENNLI